MNAGIPMAGGRGHTPVQAGQPELAVHIIMCMTRWYVLNVLAVAAAPPLSNRDLVFHPALRQ